MRALKLTGQVVALATVAGLLGVLGWRLTHRPKPPVVGGPAPNFVASRLDGGGTVALSSLRGKAVVINFFASWCGPCKTEAAELEKQWQRFRGKGVVFLGIDYNDPTSDARKFLAYHGVTYTTILDRSATIGDRYGLTGVPETYFVDRKGRIVGEHILGPITTPRWAAAFQRGVQAALGS
ncbi:MAG: cytochrome c biosis protein CcmG, thiol:disulfide interchange protein DsbE [Gaiellaceae bacterium]|jgi:cytochrome c biogenesis protein CcmG/thiol:disulfide interchange protein DsbE|nr:cytochrome c biosis protein CcmG, thiol:disulfide interchange protein DsbE [Gaiellaceae bacterium]MDX6469558.1 cytochrome c biosis protein CcmG, thiol:disulfide interchange protein DsbE [Gaiellaceae bacterium]MDX6472561.1 cytochrome c biosis protein CcmG, thiol:disulfide interchange protein DsbE [Gaiellaceae bacterium]